MTKEVYGSMTINSRLDITDPCYDEDVWCRINNFPIPAGEYECYVLTADDVETHGWGNRIARIGISSEDEVDHFERIGMIGVDSGMAGFFTCDNRLRFEDAIGDDDRVYAYDDAFFSESGYGDGCYDVYAGYKDGKLVELYIKFI